MHPNEILLVFAAHGMVGANRHFERLRNEAAKLSPAHVEAVVVQAGRQRAQMERVA